MIDSLISVISNKSKKHSHYQVGEHQLPIVASARRKSIAIKQQKDGLVLAVPKTISTSRLNQILQYNHSWLEKRINDLVENTPLKFNGLHGEQLSFLGQDYTLIWLDSAEQNHQQANVELSQISKKIQLIFSTGLDEPQKKNQSCQALEQFFKHQAQSYLNPKIDFYAEQMGLEYQSVTVKGYKSRWGSCYSDGRIQFNWRLMQAPQWVVDYVIVHELAHLVHANHSKAFWGLVEEFYPQTPAAKQVIKQHGRAWIDFLQ